MLTPSCGGASITTSPPLQFPFLAAVSIWTRTVLHCTKTASVGTHWPTMSSRYLSAIIRPPAGSTRAEGIEPSLREMAALPRLTGKNSLNHPLLFSTAAPSLPTTNPGPADMERRLPFVMDSKDSHSCSSHHEQLLQQHQDHPQRPMLSIRTELPIKIERGLSGLGCDQTARSPTTPSTAGTATTPGSAGLHQQFGLGQPGHGSFLVHSPDVRTMGQQSSPAEPPKKKKGTRSVSNLTPAQLARKRANDREAQRAIRARTKENTERLERELANMTHNFENAKREIQDRDKLITGLQAANTSLQATVASLRREMGAEYDPLPSMASTNFDGPSSAMPRNPPPSVFADQPTTPASRGPDYSLIGSSGGPQFSSPDDASPQGPAYVTGGIADSWSSSLISQPMHQTLPSPSSGDPHSTSNAENQSFMGGRGNGPGIEGIPILNTPVPQELEFGDAEMGRFHSGASMSPSPVAADAAHVQGTHSPLGTIASQSGQMQGAPAPFLHHPHPQHFQTFSGVAAASYQSPQSNFQPPPFYNPSGTGSPVHIP